MSQNNLSEVRKTCLEMVSDIFNLGMRYVKHKTIAQFFVGIFKPRIDSVVKKEAPESELITAMWLVKGRIDPVLAKLEKIEQVLSTRELNGDTRAQKFIETRLLKDVEAYMPKKIIIDEGKACEILMRLKKHGS